MALTVLPTRVDLWAKTEEQVEGFRERAIVRGRSYELAMQITDTDGNPVDLGPNDDLNWELRAVGRNQPERLGGQIIWTAAMVPVDGPTGQIKLKLVPSATENAVLIDGVWDVEMENVSDGNFDPGFEATPFSGKWRMIDDVTVE